MENTQSGEISLFQLTLCADAASPFDQDAETVAIYPEILI